MSKTECDVSLPYEMTAVHMLFEQVYLVFIYILFIELTMVTLATVALLIALIVTIKKLDKKNTSLSGR